MSDDEPPYQPHIFGVCRGPSAAELLPKHSKPRTQTFLSCSEGRTLRLFHPFGMSEGDTETTSFETRSNKPFLYSINSTLPSDNEAYILRLPNELLKKCLQNLVDGDPASNAEMKRPRGWRRFTPHDRFCTSSRSIWASSVTCKTFSQLSKPLLYSDLVILEPSFLSDDELMLEVDDRARHRLRQFYRSVTESPELMAYCRVMHVALKQPIWLHCEAALQQQTPLLQELTLEGSDLRFERLGNVLGKLRYLKVLILSGVQCHAARAAHPNPAVEKQRAACDRAALPLPDQCGTATFTELHLQNFSRASPYALANFLRWPQALQVFTVGIIGMGGYDLDGLIGMNILTYPWTFDLLAYALRSHSTSIRELRVGQMSTQEGLNNFDLHKFPNLEVFQVCTSYIPTADRAAQLWLTPKLKRLVLESSFDDSQHGQCFSFDESDMRWLKRFGAIAARDTDAAKVGLKTIEVLYEIDDYTGKYHVESCRQVEALFVRTTELIATYGLEFVYPAEVFRSLGSAAVEDEDAGN